MTIQARRALFSPPPHGRRSPLTTLVLVLLLANALPAFVILQAVPGRTEDWFVWTIHPDANARVLAVMYGNAFLLALAAWFARDWGTMRVTMIVAALFSVAATVVTFVTLDPFLTHPWFFLAYWLFNYLLLCLTAPIDLVVNERLRGGRLAATTPLRAIARAAAAVLAAGLAFFSVSLLLELSTVSSLWPFEITPLVSRILGVWLGALAVAHAWIAWDGDRRRARPLLVAMPPTGVLLAIVPLLHRGDVRPGAAGSLAAYLTLAAAMIVLPGLALSRRATAATLAPRTNTA